VLLLISLKFFIYLAVNFVCSLHSVFDFCINCPLCTYNCTKWFILLHLSFLTSTHSEFNLLCIAFVIHIFFSLSLTLISISLSLQVLAHSITAHCHSPLLFAIITVPSARTNAWMSQYPIWIFSILKWRLLSQKFSKIYFSLCKEHLRKSREWKLYDWRTPVYIILSEIIFTYTQIKTPN